jgi:hypothetical protein
MMAFSSHLVEFAVLVCLHAQLVLTLHFVNHALQATHYKLTIHAPVELPARLVKQANPIVLVVFLILWVLSDSVPGVQMVIIYHLFTHV